MVGFDEAENTIQKSKSVVGFEPTEKRLTQNVVTKKNILSFKQIYIYIYIYIKGLTQTPVFFGTNIFRIIGEKMSFFKTSFFGEKTNMDFSRRDVSIKTIQRLNM